MFFGTIIEAVKHDSMQYMSSNLIMQDIFNMQGYIDLFSFFLDLN